MLVTTQYTVTITEHDGGAVKDQWNEWMVKWNTGMTPVTFDNTIFLRVDTSLTSCTNYTKVICSTPLMYCFLCVSV